MKKLNKKGFTLVELLAVIVVLALLMVVAASTIGNALENSKKSALKTETQKLLKTVYEEKQALIVTGSLGANLSTTGTDGSYKYKITVNTDGEITDYCVQYITSGTSYKYFMSGTGKTLKGKLEADTETDAQVKEYSDSTTAPSSCDAS